MSRERTENTAAGRKLHPLVLIAVLAVVLILAALIVYRLYGWNGQREEGQLQFTALVNPWNGVDSVGYRPELTKVQGVEVDQRCAQALDTLINDCRAEGNRPVLAAGYLSGSALESHANRSTEEAQAGFSEHETGLAVDIQDESGGDPSGSGTMRWLEENAWRYGFILRYPEGSEEITGVPASPWHYRYVGEQAAAQIHQMNITLEDYVSMFYNDAAEVVFEK